MTSPRPFHDIASDPGAVIELLRDSVPRLAVVRPETSRVEVIKQNAKRVVARYELADAQGAPVLTLAGKWYATDRGELVARQLTALQGVVDVPAVLHYDAAARALFVEWVEGPLLRDVLAGPGAAGAAAAFSTGGWLARFHASRLTSTRRCGPRKQRDAVAKWARERPALQPAAASLRAALDGYPDPGRPVHYDFYHQQVIVTEGATPVVVDLDEAGVGDPAFDVEHFCAHLELLALIRTGDPSAYGAAAAAFRAGYESVASIIPNSPVLGAFAWYKLAFQAIRKERSSAIQHYSLDSVLRMLATA